MTPVPETVSVDAPEPLSPSPSADGSSVVSRTPAAMSMSPPRPKPQQQLPQHSTPVPGSPAPSSAADRSPAITPTQQQRMDVFLPAETGVVLGLQQLERQQDEAERRRREDEAERRRREQLAAQAQQQPQPQTTTTTNTQQTTRPQQQQTQQQQQHTPPTQRVHSSPITMRYLDDDTAPSSTLESATRDAASHTGDGSLGSGDDSSAQQQQQYKESNKFGRMIKKTKKRLSSNDFLRRRSSGDLDDPAAEDEEEGAVDALIYGHLQKLGRNGKWQTRWFESDGECLSYYKTSKRSKLLATLDLEKVGAIVVNEDDPKGCSFTIQVLGRPYYLRAESRAACKDWVITLNRVKEARLQQGNVKLIHLRKHILFRSPPDLLTGNETAYTQGIAIENPHRPRTRAVDESTMENIEEMMHRSEVDPTEPTAVAPAAYYHQTDDTESLSQVVLARWQKRKTSMNRLASKLAKWARSLNKYRCAESEVEGGARLDRHVHPPGHDNMTKSGNPAFLQSAPSPVPEHEVVPPPKDAALSGWIGKETSLAVNAGPVVLDPDEALEALDVIENIETQVTNDPVPHSVTSVGSPLAPEVEVEETRELS
jgi:hypothetical protein